MTVSFAGHVHAEGYAALAAAAARFATVAGWDAWLAWATGVFEYLRARSTRYGFVPDRIGLAPSYYWYWYGRESLPPTCETCGLVDALELGITLAERGHEEYWDDVERWTRNHFVASQLGTPETWATATPGRPTPMNLLAAADNPLACVVAGASTAPPPRAACWTATRAARAPWSRAAAPAAACAGYSWPGSTRWRTTARSSRCISA